MIELLSLPEAEQTFLFCRIISGKWWPLGAGRKETTWGLVSRAETPENSFFPPQGSLGHTD